MTTELIGMVFAVTDMLAVVKFYRGVFDVDWQAGMQVGEHQFYSGTWLGIDWVICPNAIAEVDATQNRHQFRLKVDDIHAILDRALQHGGTIINPISEMGAMMVASVRDPDGNSIELFQDL